MIFCSRFINFKLLDVKDFEMEMNGDCKINGNNANHHNVSFKKVTHVLFDMDGVILDTECIYEDIVTHICRKYGKEYPRETRLRVMGTTEQMTSEIICREVGLPITPEDFREQMNNKGEELFMKVKLMKGAKRLIEHLYRNGIPIALATSSGKPSVQVKTQNYTDLFGLFSHKVMGSSDPEVKHGKPHPDIYLICASRFADRPKPEDCLVIEDAPNGVISGRAAGMQVVMTPDPSLDYSQTSKATLVVDSLLDFRPELFGLPPFKDNGAIPYN